MDKGEIQLDRTQLYKTKGAMYASSGGHTKQDNMSHRCGGGGLLTCAVHGLCNTTHHQHKPFQNRSSFVRS